LRENCIKGSVLGFKIIDHPPEATDYTTIGRGPSSVLEQRGKICCFRSMVYGDKIDLMHSG
jgi:hypothetical protein